MVASIDDPGTWTEWGQIDPELDKMMKLNPNPAFAKQPDIAAIVQTRIVWSPKYKAFEQLCLQGSGGAVTSHEIEIPLRDGTLSRTVVYHLSTADDGGQAREGRPLIVFVHGGGFVFGTPEMDGRNAADAVHAYGCIAMSLSYRLAPEKKHPTAVEDCWDALQWIAKNAASVGADLAKGFVLGGTSAGGNIAIVLSHWARDEKMSPPLTGLWLNVPLVLAPEAVRPEHESMYKSREQNALSPVLNKAFMDMYTEAYAPPDIPNNYIWSPMNWPGDEAERHAALPRTYFQICGLDPLRDEGLMYERELRLNNSISTRVDVYPGLPHMFVPNFPRHPSSKKYPEDTKRGLGWLLGLVQ